jgi:hypothetical protein
MVAGPVQIKGTCKAIKELSFLKYTGMAIFPMPGGWGTKKPVDLKNTESGPIGSLGSCPEKLEPTRENCEITIPKNKTKRDFFIFPPYCGFVK